MPLRWTFKLGRIAGIDIRVHPSWLIIYALFTGALTAGAKFLSPDLNDTSSLLLGLIASLVLFASVVAHEFAHAMVARRLGIPIGGITLFLFGGVAMILREPTSPADEIRMAIAGPALSVVLSALFFGLSFGASALHWGWGGTFCGLLAITNAMLAAFNLLPAFPSDGGRVLRASLWMLQGSQARATGLASIVSLVVAVGLVGAGLYFVISPHEYRGLWWMLIGGFLAQAAMSSARQARTDLTLERMRVSDCMLKTLVPVPANMLVASFIGEIAGKAGEAYPVVDQGVLIGLADVRQTAGLPLALWSRTPVSAVMTPIEKLKALSGLESARNALTQLHDLGINELPVYENGELIGIVSQESIFRALPAGVR